MSSQPRRDESRLPPGQKDPSEGSSKESRPRPPSSTINQQELVEALMDVTGKKTVVVLK